MPRSDPQAVRGRRGTGHRAGRRVHDLVEIALAATLLVAFGPVASGEEPPLPRHELVFARHSDAARSDYDLWRICADGTQLASLVSSPGNQLQVAVSPDGEHLAWAGYSGGQRDIWRRLFAAGEPRNLTDHPADDQGPVWSRDGTRLAFFSTRDHEKPELYLMGAEGGPAERLTVNRFHDSGADWSPDGGTIVFTRYFPGDGADHQGNGEIVALDIETGEERQLTELGGYNGGLSFSPDGARIAFHRTWEGRAELWIMAADGSAQRPLTDTFVDEYSPIWSPDGNWLAFTAGTGNDSQGTFDLWLMRPDGSRRHALSRAANTEAWPAWRPGERYCR